MLACGDLVETVLEILCNDGPKGADRAHNVDDSNSPGTLAHDSQGASLADEQGEVVVLDERLIEDIPETFPQFASLEEIELLFDDVLDIELILFVIISHNSIQNNIQDFLKFI